MASTQRNPGIASIGNVNVDWLETDKEHIFNINLPGMKKEEVSIQVLPGNVLQISGEKKEKEEGVVGEWHVVERARGSFLRQIKLPDDANVNKIRAQAIHGVVTIYIPLK